MFRGKKSKFYGWISKSLSREIPPETVGIHFNFYEAEGSIHIQLFGMSSYQSGEDPVRDYWPGEETFSTEENVFEYPIGKLGDSWSAMNTPKTINGIRMTLTGRPLLTDDVLEQIE